MQPAGTHARAARFRLAHRSRSPPGPLSGGAPSRRVPPSVHRPPPSSLLVTHSVRPAGPRTDCSPQAMVGSLHCVTGDSCQQLTRLLLSSPGHLSRSRPRNLPCFSNWPGCVGCVRAAEVSRPADLLRPQDAGSDHERPEACGDVTQASPLPRLLSSDRRFSSGRLVYLQRRRWPHARPAGAVRPDSSTEVRRGSAGSPAAGCCPGPRCSRPVCQRRPRPPQTTAARADTTW